MQDFNPRTLKGYDPDSVFPTIERFDFNPRTLKGYDSGKDYELQRGVNFNPRTLKGYDAFLQMPTRDWRISIHVPSRGTTAH